MPFSCGIDTKCKEIKQREKGKFKIRNDKHIVLFKSIQACPGCRRKKAGYIQRMLEMDEIVDK